MDDEFKENHPILEKLVSARWLVIEVPLFLPLDMAAVWLLRRPRRTRFIKKRAPWLSCRRYPLFNPGSPDCGPAQKYEHKGLFKAVVCGYYDIKSGECHHPAYWSPEDK